MSTFSFHYFFFDLLFQFAFNLPHNDKLIVNRARLWLLNPCGCESFQRLLALYLTINSIFSSKDKWVSGPVIYPAFSLLSLRFVFWWGDYGCLGVGASETDSSVEEKKTEKHSHLVRFISRRRGSLSFRYILLFPHWSFKRWFASVYKCFPTYTRSTC